MKIQWPRTVQSALRWMINARRGSSGRPRRVAGIMPTRNYANAASTLETLRELCDVVIVLDDNSDAPFPHRSSCTEVVSIANREPWNATANLTLLLYRAFVHGCEWVVSLDDDIILSGGFNDRAAVNDVIDSMESGRRDICHFRLWDLWNSGSEVRVDGVWGQKTFPVVRRNWFFEGSVTLRDPAMRLHAGAFPADLRARGIIHPAHAAYHTGCLTPQARALRVEKYRREDPDNAFQADYSYMLDDRNLRLRAVPDPDRAVIRRKLRPDLRGPDPHPTEIQ